MDSKENTIPIITELTNYEFNQLSKFKNKHKDRYNEMIEFVEFCKEQATLANIKYNTDWRYILSFDIPLEDSESKDDKNYKASVVFARYEDSEQLNILENKTF